MQILFENLLKESQLLNEGRVEDAREKYPKIKDDEFKVFLDEDPSGNNKYLMAVCKLWFEEYGAGYYSGRVSGARDLMELVTYFHSQTQKFEKKDMGQYKTLSEFKKKVNEAKQNLTKGEIKKSATKIFEDGRHLVVVPLTHAASCFYGAGTQWCTTMRNNSQYFRQYTDKGSLMYYINKGNGKKRAFFTSYKEPFLSPATVSGERNDQLGRTEVYTETDNRGRSLRGVPIGARQAMNLEHQKGFRKFLETLSFDNRVVYMIRNGMELPEDYTTFNGNWSMNVKVPNQITKINGDMRVDGSLGLNNVTEVTGTLSLGRGFSDFGGLKIIGGNLDNSNYWRGTNIDNLGEITSIGGSLHWNNLSTIKIEAIRGLEHLCNIIVNSQQVESLELEIKLPELPNTKITRR